MEISYTHEGIQKGSWQWSEAILWSRVRTLCSADTLASHHDGSSKATGETFQKVARLIESTSQFDFLDARRYGSN